MKKIYLRPLALFALSFYIFSALLFYSDGGIKLPLGVLCLALSVFLALLFRGKPKQAAAAVLLFALSASLIFTSLTADRDLQASRRLDGTEAQVRGEVTEVLWQSSYGTYCIMHIDESDGRQIDLTVCLETSVMLQRGDMAEGRVVFSLFPESGAGGRQYYASRGATLAARDLSEVQVTGKASDGLIFRLRELNDRLSARLVVLLGRREGGFAASVLLGNKTYLDGRLSTDIGRLGISHLTALSGLHLTVICSLAGTLLSPLGRKASALLKIPVIVFYIFLTGFSPSLVRAGVMLIICILLSLLGRGSDSVTNLGAAVLLITLFSPYAVCDIGLQLSAAAMLGVILSARLKEKAQEGKSESRARRVLFFLVSPFAVSAFAVIFTLPLTALYFGSFSAVGILASIPFSVLITLILWLLPFALVLWEIPVLGGFLCALCTFLCRLFVFSAQKLSMLGRIVVQAKAYMLPVISAIPVLVSAAMLTESKKRRKVFTAFAAGCTAVLFLISAAPRFMSGEAAHVQAVSVSSGDALLLERNGRLLLSDMSDGSYTLYKKAEEAMTESGIYEIETLVITNPKPAHAAALYRLRERTVIRLVLLPGENDYLTCAAEDCGARVSYYEPGESIDFYGARLQTFENLYISRSVRPVIRLRAENGGESLMYMGASASEAGAEIPPSQVLWLGGYGPRYKSAVSISAPEVRIICSDKALTYAPESCERAEEAVISLGGKQ